MKLKKISVFVLAVILCVTFFTACGKKDGQPDSTDKTDFSQMISTDQTWDPSGEYKSDDPACTLSVRCKGGKLLAMFKEDGSDVFYGSAEFDGLTAEVTVKPEGINEKINFSVESAGDGSVIVTVGAATADSGRKAGERFGMTPVEGGSGDFEYVSGDNPAVDYEGTYSKDQWTVEVEAVGKSEARFSITMPGEDEEESSWTMSGRFDPETKQVSYSNAFKIDKILDQHGVPSYETMVENGSGFFEFGDSTLDWTDAEENKGNVIVFDAVGK